LEGAFFVHDPNSRRVGLKKLSAFLFVQLLYILLKAYNLLGIQSGTKVKPLMIYKVI